MRLLPHPLTSLYFILGLFTITNIYTQTSVGINTVTPVSTLDVNGTLKVGNSLQPPVKGMIRWNDTTSDFEGFNGAYWISLTKSYSTWGKPTPSTTNESSKKTANDGVAEDSFGNALDISGDYTIIGAIGCDIGINENQGAAYIYKKSENGWVEQAKLVSNDGAAYDQFGYSVAINGDYAIVGAFEADPGGNADQGAAYLFHRIGNTWTQEAKFVANDGTSNSRFGASVDIVDEYAAVGAISAETGPMNVSTGAAYIYNKSGATWTQQAKLISNTPNIYDNFGQTLHLQNEEILIGAPHYDVGTKADQGAVFVFKRTGSTWMQTDQLVPVNQMENNTFGISISIDRDHAIIGASGENQSKGAAYIYKRSSNIWQEEARLALGDLVELDNFGNSVSISRDYAVVGANGVENSKGASFIYKKNGIYWDLMLTIKASDAVLGDKFGSAVGLSDLHTLVGAPGSNMEQGSIYFFNKN